MPLFDRSFRIRAKVSSNPTPLAHLCLHVESPNGGVEPPGAPPALVAVKALPRARSAPTPWFGPSRCARGGAATAQLPASPSPAGHAGRASRGLESDDRGTRPGVGSSRHRRDHRVADGPTTPVCGDLYVCRLVSARTT